MRNRIVFRPSAAVAMQPSPALRHSVSPAFNLEASLAGKTTMQIMTATQHGQTARLPQKKEQTQMKMRITALVALTLGLGAFTVLAQDQSGGPGGPPGGGHPPAMSIMTALDANADGTLDATEIANASASLLQLDVNGDGSLSKEELRPKGHGGPGGPPEGGGPGGPAGSGGSGQPSAQ
jgi:hypothetical protein